MCVCVVGGCCLLRLCLLLVCQSTAFLAQRRLSQVGFGPLVREAQFLLNSNCILNSLLHKRLSTRSNKTMLLSYPVRELVKHAGLLMPS